MNIHDEIVRSIDTRGVVRLCLLEEGRIVAEGTNCYEESFVLFGDSPTRSEIAAMSPESLTAWDGSPKFYLAEISRGVGMVTEVFAERQRAEQFTKGAGGRARTRHEMLHDPDFPALKTALTRWESGDDHLIKEHALARALRKSRLTAEGRSMLAWGTVQDETELPRHELPEPTPESHARTCYDTVHELRAEGWPGIPEELSDLDASIVFAAMNLASGLRLKPGADPRWGELSRLCGKLLSSGEVPEEQETL